MSTRGQDAPFGARLRRLRDAAGFTQEELAERAGLTGKGISDLERSRRRHPYPHTVRSLADALGLSEEERELEEVRDLIRRREMRLLTLTGTGGVGKTRLAIQAGWESADLFPDGVVFVALAPLNDPALVTPTVERSLGLRDLAMIIGPLLHVAITATTKGRYYEPAHAARTGVADN